MFTLKAPAKINWFLRVTARRPDGFHEIQSLMQKVALFDTLVFEDASALSILTEAPIPADDNLVLQAALRLREATNTKGGARITLTKKIPISAGLGGGSSDAAAALIGLNKLWGMDLPAPELAEIAAGLGSDVPFFLGGPTAMASGRGEVLSPVSLPSQKRPCTLLLAKPNKGVSTAWAYSEVKNFSPDDPAPSEQFVKDLAEGNLGALAKQAVNDLQGPVAALRPEVDILIKRLTDLGATFSSMSGSGPTVFGVFGDRAAAERADAYLRADWSAIVETLN